MALPPVFSDQHRQPYVSAWSDINFDEDTVWLITWNPKPKFYNYDKYGENDYNMQWHTMIDALSKSIRCLLKFAFVPEVSEVGKLHMHGWYVIKDKVKYRKSFKRMLLRTGMVKESQVKYHEWKTYKYHIKELKDITPQFVTNIRPLCYTHENRKYIERSLTLKQVLVAVDYDKKIKKRNVYELMGIKLEDETASESL